MTVNIKLTEVETQMWWMVFMEKIKQDYDVAHSAYTADLAMVETRKRYEND